MRIIRFVNSVFNSNTYIIDNDEDDIWLVDCGDSKPIVDYVNKKNLTIKGILLTHVHYDHFYGIPEIVRLFPECIIFTSEEGVEALASDKINFSKYHSHSISLSSPNIKILNNGEKVELWDSLNITAIRTPGHNYTCISYIIKPYIFTGDSFIPGLDTIVSLPNSDKKKAAESQLQIQKLVEMEKLTICPGHQDIYPYKS